MAPQARKDEDVRQVIELVGLSYADWEKEANQLRAAADGAELGRLADRHHLVRAGELVVEIETELAELDELFVTSSGDILAQLIGVTDRLQALLKDVRASAHILHGMT